MKRLILAQFDAAKNKTTLWLTPVIVLVLMLSNYFRNVVTYRGADLVEMIQPMHLLVLGNRSLEGNLLLILFPALCVLPAADLYYRENASSTEKLLCVRAGKLAYYTSRLTATFLITFLSFAFPLLIEVILNCIAFPLNAIGIPEGYGLYTDSYRTYAEALLFPHLASFPYVYAPLGILLFSFLGAILAVLSEAVSMVIQFPLRLFLFLPPFIVLYAPTFFARLFLRIDTSYLFYLRLFDCSVGKNPLVPAAVVCVVLFLTAICLFKRIRSDTL